MPRVGAPSGGAEAGIGGEDIGEEGREFGPEGRPRCPEECVDRYRESEADEGAEDAGGEESTADEADL